MTAANNKTHQYKEKRERKKTHNIQQWT